MPMYVYKCVKCGYEFTTYSSVENRDKAKKCTMCNSAADRNFMAQLQGSQICQQDVIRHSWSLGVVNPNNPEEMKVAHQVHPGAEFDSLGRMVIHNRAEKIQRMKEKSKAIGQEWIEYN